MLLFLTACLTQGPELAPPPAEAPVSRFHIQGARPLIRLSDLVESAQIELPPTSVPVGADLPGRFAMADGWTQDEESGRRNLWRHDSPIELTRRSYQVAPPLTFLESGGERLPYTYPPGASRGRAWTARDDSIFLSSESDPGTWASPPVLVAEAVLSADRRLEPEASGLDPARFVRHELTLDLDTRPGLLLPAPSRATFQVDLPPGATLETWTAVAPLGITDGPESDGATLVIEVDGVEVGRADVEPGEQFRPVKLALGKAGPATVTLRTESADTAWDYVFLGEPTISGEADGEVRRVIVVGIDTLRYAEMSQQGQELPTSAALDSFASSSVIFDNAFTSAPRTRPSFRTAFTGRQPFPAINANTFGEVFREAGWATAGISGNLHLVPRFGFNDGFDWWLFENSPSAWTQIGRAKDWLTENSDRDAFLFLHLMDPHAFYKAPWPWMDMFVDSEPGPYSAEQNRWMVLAVGSHSKDENKRWLHQRYQGEVAWMSWNLARFFKWLETLPGQTLVVVHSDHGEEFWEHGSYEHNHSLYQELVHGNLWFRLPGGHPDAPRQAAQVGIVDLAPTLYDLAGLQPLGPVDGLSLRPLLDAGQAEQASALLERLAARALPIGHLMYDKERWAVVHDGWKYILQTWGGQEELYNLVEDPGEQNNLAPITPRAVIDQHLDRLGEATGWPAGPGWRVRILESKTPFTITFTRPVSAAILDPETDVRRRANIEWGVSPAHWIEDVGAVLVSADGLSVTFTPGTWARGTLAIRTGAWTDTGTLLVGEESREIPAMGGSVKVEGISLRVDPGAVILPRQTLRDFLANGDDDTSLDALCALGYVDCTQSGGDPGGD